MPPRRSKLPLLAGLLCSLLIHAWLLLPGLIAVMTGGELYSMTARFTPEEIRPPELPEEETTPDQTLGLDNGAPSTLTWIGYEEYQEQRAALAQTEQAAFSETPGPRNPNPPASSVPPIPVADSASAQESTEKKPDTEPPPASPTPSETPASPAIPSPFDQVLALLNDLQDAATNPPSKTDTAPKKSSKPEVAKKTEPTPPPTPITPPTPQNPSKPISGGGSGIPADPSDRESDASSIVEVPVDQMKIGKPLSAKGLKIKTRRPDFTNLQKLTALPGNPLYEIAFDRTGRPRKVKPLELAGDKGIDAAVQASLYRWRAKGKPLQKLGPQQTLKFKIRIMLNRGRGK